jgi:hypothetical protein
MKWFLKRFKYTRELEEAVREKDYELDAMDHGLSLYRRIIDDYREMETAFTNLTLADAHDLFAACVDYQNALKMLVAADPIQNRIIPIMDKYGIKIERNTLADDVVEGAEMMLKARDENTD